LLPKEQLRDIKPLVEIPDISHTIFMALVILGSLLIFGILFFVLKKLWDNRKKNMAKEYLARLNAINWQDTKKSAYEATKYGRLLATDQRRKELFSQLEPLLNQYKYKKEVGSVDEETLNKFRLYVQVANESV
jgi:hypothetical protein